MGPKHMAHQTGTAPGRLRKTLEQTEHLGAGEALKAGPALPEEAWRAKVGRLQEGRAQQDHHGRSRGNHTGLRHVRRCRVPAYGCYQGDTTSSALVPTARAANGRDPILTLIMYCGAASLFDGRPLLLHEAWKSVAYEHEGRAPSAGLRQ